MMNMQNLMSTFQQLASNPAQYAMTQWGIPQNIANNPNAILQQLMSSGRISQAQYNQARQMASQMQNNPFFKQFMRY